MWRKQAIQRAFGPVLVGWCYGQAPGGFLGVGSISVLQRANLIEFVSNGFKKRYRPNFVI